MHPTFAGSICRFFSNPIVIVAGLHTGCIICYLTNNTLFNAQICPLLVGMTSPMIVPLAVN